MAYCTKCGNSNPGSAKFCTSCGALMQENQGSTAPGRPASKIWMFTSIIAIAGLCVAGYFLFIHRKTRSDKVKEMSTVSPGPGGQYPQASQRLLTDNELSNLTAAELRIMRNEIYARHGLIFQNPDMKAHFQSQSWYTGRYDNVISFLSDIEKNNIAMIRRYEKYLDATEEEYAR